MNKTKVLILCGGQGLRIKGYFDKVPKPLIPIGEKPVLEYIIQSYVNYGFQNFILLVGKDEVAFREFSLKNSNDQIQIQVLQTGSETSTGGRIKRAKEYIKESEFFCLTYGDGIANVDFEKQLAFHKSHNKMATLTAVHPQLPFGLLNLDSNLLIKSFVEKPLLESYVNGGFFVLNREVFDELQDDSDFEIDILPELSIKNQLCAFIHKGLWKNIDTYKDYLFLEENIHYLK